MSCGKSPRPGSLRRLGCLAAAALLSLWAQTTVSADPQGQQPLTARPSPARLDPDPASLGAVAVGGQVAPDDLRISTLSGSAWAAPLAAPGQVLRSPLLDAAPPAGGGAPPTGASFEELPVRTITPAVSYRAPTTGPPTTGSLAELVGPNRQPLWTTKRRFTTSRAYVSAPWQVEFESWWEGKFKKNGDERHRYLEEVSIGLPGRFQFDFYWRIQDETGEELRTQDFQVEARWALAAWDVIPLNPTLYLEYKFLEGDEPEAWEAKLLLADDLGGRWQGAVNLFYEAQTSGDEEIELGATAAVSYTLFDPKLSVGLELKFESTTARGSRDDPENELLLGPSIQWRPFRGVHLDVAPLVGLTDDSPDMQVWIVLGFDILPGTSARAASLPTSVRAR